MNEAFNSVESITHLGELLKNMMTLMAICSLRFYAAMQIMPMTTEQSIQGPSRNALALTVGFFVAWGQPLALFNNLSMAMLIAAMAKEILLGLCMGYAVSVVFWVAEGVGILLDNQAGFNNVQQQNPLSGEQSTPLGNLLSQLSIASFYILGGLPVLLGLFIESYRFWPVALQGPVLSDGLLLFLDSRTSDYFNALIKLAMPAVFVFVIIDIGIGLLSKTADKLEPNSIGQPIKGALALFLLGLLVALFFQHARPQLALRDMSGLLQAVMAKLKQ